MEDDDQPMKMSPEEEKKWEETVEWLIKTTKEIKVENGLPPDAPGPVCIGCRKMIQSEDGLWYCDCHDERKK